MSSIVDCIVSFFTSLFPRKRRLIDNEGQTPRTEPITTVTPQESRQPNQHRIADPNYHNVWQQQRNYYLIENYRIDHGLQYPNYTPRQNYPNRHSNIQIHHPQSETYHHETTNDRGQSYLNEFPKLGGRGTTSSAGLESERISRKKQSDRRYTTKKSKPPVSRQQETIFYSTHIFSSRYRPAESSEFFLQPTKIIPLEELKELAPYDWKRNKCYESYVLNDIDKNSAEYIDITALFKRSTQNNLKIENIHRVENLYVWLIYILKSEGLRQSYDQINKNYFFHGTNEENVNSICYNNFDWRQHGTNKGHRFGHGVSFSPLASYASHYTDEYICSGNKMFLCLVNVRKTCLGDGNMVLPPEDCDTTVNHERKVFVKYDDNTFYPCYLITYQGKLQHITSTLK